MARFAVMQLDHLYGSSLHWLYRYGSLTGLDFILEGGGEKGLKCEFNFKEAMIPIIIRRDHSIVPSRWSSAILKSEEAELKAEHKAVSEQRNIHTITREEAQITPSKPFATKAASQSDEPNFCSQPEVDTVRQHLIYSIANRFNGNKLSSLEAPRRMN